MQNWDRSQPLPPTSKDFNLQTDVYMKKNIVVDDLKKKILFQNDSPQSSDFYKSSTTTTMGVSKSTTSSAASASVFTIENILSSKPKLLSSNTTFPNGFSPFTPERGVTFTPISTSVTSGPFQFRPQSATVNLNQLASVAAATFNPPTSDFLSK